MSLKQYLIIGRSGTGKSSLINTTFGRYIAATAEFEACTRIVGYHAYGTPWGDLELIDTPGFAEEGRLEDERVVELIATGVDVERADAVLLVTRLDETRMRPDESRMIELLTGRFGEAFWLKAWMMMTFAASVSEGQRADRAVARASDLNEAVRAAIMRHWGRCRFDGFQEYWLVDNVVSRWDRDLIPLGKALFHAA